MLRKGDVFSKSYVQVGSWKKRRFSKTHKPKSWREFRCFLPTWFVKFCELCFEFVWMLTNSNLRCWVVDQPGAQSPPKAMAPRSIRPWLTSSWPSIAMSLSCWQSESLQQLFGYANWIVCFLFKSQFVGQLGIKCTKCDHTNLWVWQKRVRNKRTPQQSHPQIQNCC